MSLDDYLVGVAGLAAIAASLGFGAHRLRGRLLPGWSGAAGLLADAVLAVAALLLLAELLGLIGLLEGVGLVIGALLVGGAGVALGGPPSPADQAEAEQEDGAGADTAMTLVALALAALVTAHWAIASQVTLEIGSYNGDDLINHLPFAARFAQEGSITALNFVSPSYLVWLYPANSELLHSTGMLLFQTDLTAPLLNLLWLGLAFLAAWCFGSRFGAAPQALAGAALLADLPVLVQSQAGTAKNDLFALAFLLAAAALLVQARERDSGLGLPLIAGLAAGIAAGTKFSLIPPVGGLAVGVAWAAGRGERLRPTAVFGGAALLTGGLWYLRNLFHAGNPLPWVSSLGPIDLPGLDQSFNSPPDHSVVGYLTDGTVLSDWFEPGLSSQLGPLWPLILLAGIGGLAVGLLQRRHPQLRVVSLAGAIALLFYLFQPNGAEGPEGRPELFAYQLRHLAAPLMLGLLTAISLTGAWSKAARWAVLAALGALTLFATRRGLEFWEEASFLAGAALIALLIVGVPAALLAVWGRGPSGRRPAAALALAAGLALVVGGWTQARDRDETRYLSGFPESYYQEFQLSPNAADLRAAYGWAQGERDARIGTSAALQNGLYDFDLSNRVEFIGVHGADAAFDRPRTCAEWVRAVNEGDYDYVVAAPLYGGAAAREIAWTAGSPSAVPVPVEGKVARVFRLEGPLQEAGCSRPGRPD